MPELPEVETVMRGLETVLTGRRIAEVRLARSNLRFPFPPDFDKRIAGRLVLHLKRRAKYILAYLEGGEVLILHLGMSGRFTIIDVKGRMTGLGEFYDETAGPESGSGPHDHVVFTREDGLRIIYTDPRRFGLMDLVAEEGLASHRLLAAIGIEPLGNEFGAATLADGFRGKTVRTEGVVSAVCGGVADVDGIAHGGSRLPAAGLRHQPAGDRIERVRDHCLSRPRRAGGARTSEMSPTG